MRTKRFGIRMTKEEFDIFGKWSNQNGDEMYDTIRDEAASALEIDSPATIFNEIDQENPYESMRVICRERASTLGIHEDVFFILLIKNSWAAQTIMEQWAKDRLTLLGSIGLTPENAAEFPGLRPGNEGSDEECEICCEELDGSEMLALPCGHLYCRNCWLDAINGCIECANIAIQCPSDSCRCMVPPTSLQDFVSEDSFNTLIRFIQKNQEEKAQFMTTCPGKGCGRSLVTFDKTYTLACKCNYCRYEFCLKCHEESHAPIDCGLITRWLHFTDPDLMAQRLYGENFKKCPHCNVNIEKNGGCNHMTCKHCSHEFCWMCMADWKTHPKDFYHCANYNAANDPFLKKPDNVSPQLLDKYNTEYQKYTVKVAQYAEKREQVTNNILQVFMKAGHRGEEKEALVYDLVDQIYWAMVNLRWGYVYLFFIALDMVVNLQPSTQLNAVNSFNFTRPEQREYLMFTFYLKKLEEAVKKCDKFLDLADKKPSQRTTINIKEIQQMLSDIRAKRICLLRQTDPHFI